MTIYCPECGTAHEEGSKTCKVCGAALSQPALAKLNWDKAETDDRDYSKHPGWFKSYIVESILLTFCCCLPMGILGIVFSLQAFSAYKHKNYELAARKSDTARKVVVCGVIAGFVLFVLLYVTGAFLED